MYFKITGFFKRIWGGFLFCENRRWNYPWVLEIPTGGWRKIMSTLSNQGIGLTSNNRCFFFLRGKEKNLNPCCMVLKDVKILAAFFWMCVFLVFFGLSCFFLGQFFLQFGTLCKKYYGFWVNLPVENAISFVEGMWKDKNKWDGCNSYERHFWYIIVFFHDFPIPSMYGIFSYIWLFLMVKYGKCR